jgi:hypothetical protein
MTYAGSNGIKRVFVVALVVLVSAGFLLAGSAFLAAAQEVLKPTLLHSKDF